MDYRFSIEGLEATYPEIAPLYRMHYAEMAKRLEGEGVIAPPFAPRLETYFRYNRDGYLVHYVLRTAKGAAVGYCNLYLTADMHNGVSIAHEDTIFVHPDHRKGVGRVFSRFILDNLKRRGVKRLDVLAATDPRIVKLWTRMGFRSVGAAMTYVF